MKLLSLIAISLTCALFSIESGARPLRPWLRNRIIDNSTVNSPTITPTKPGWHEHQIKVGNVDRWFRVYRPQRLKPKAPAVLLLHGGTQSMRKIFQPSAGGTLAWLDIAEQEGIVLLVPNGTNSETGDPQGDRQNWQDLRATNTNTGAKADDVGFMRALLKLGQQNYAIDPSRIYVTGASNGGMMTYRLLVEMPESFAAGAAFIATLPDSKTLPQPLLPTPLMIANGTDDPLVKWAGGNIPGRPDRLMSTPATVDWWLQANRANIKQPQITTLPDLNPQDGCRIIKTAYTADPGGAPVMFYKVAGGGHDMPSTRQQSTPSRLQQRLIGSTCHDAEGAKLAWDFLKNYDRSPTSPNPPKIK
jgi:polyhydroxybutyrate depolymerase